MHTALRKIGNSVGIIVPASILGEIGAVAGVSLDLRVEDGKIIATPVQGVAREGWAIAAARVAELESHVDRGWQGFGNADDAELEW